MAFDASFYRVTDEGSLPEIVQYGPSSRFEIFTALFAITAAGVVPCGGHKKSPNTSSIVQILFFF